MGIQGHAMVEARTLREVVAFEVRAEHSNAHAARRRRARLPRPGRPGPATVFGAPAARRAVEAALFPRRRPLGAEAAKQPIVAQDGARVAGWIPEVGSKQKAAGNDAGWRIRGRLPCVR